MFLISMAAEISFGGKVALITGACGDIGLATAKALEDAGAKTVITDVMNGDNEMVKSALRNFCKAEYFRMDVTDFEGTKKVAEEVLKKFGKVDILVNNAGINKDKLIKDLSKEEWEAVLKVDLTGVFNVTKAFLNGMIERKGGVIINISSIVGLDGNIGQANYSAAKGGVATLSYTLGKELARYGIRVIAIAPGFIRTKMVEAIPDKVKERILSGIPMRRFGEPEEIAKVIKFLASDEASYITATAIRIDGGTHL